jgi:hypothetical protein
MSTLKGSPNIAVDGLILCLDAANPKSYSTGSTWVDMSSSINNVSLVNDPTFTSSGVGSFLFNGVDDYGKITSLNLSSFNKITIDIWMKFTTSSLKILAEHSIDFNGSNAFVIVLNEFGGVGSFQISDRGPEGYNISYTSQGFNDGNWHNFIVVIDRSLSLTQQNKIYADGVFNTILDPGYRSDINSNFSNFDLYIGSRAGSNYFYPGSISSIKIYNRALSINEVSQNFNATKTRFGL